MYPLVCDGVRVLGPRVGPEGQVVFETDFGSELMCVVGAVRLAAF